MEKLKDSLLKPDDTAPGPPRMKMGELGYIGLRATAKRIAEEGNTKLRFPLWIKEVDLMRKDPTVAVALHLYRMMIGRVGWKVKPPVGASPAQIERAKFIEGCMHDMDHSWGQFINNVTTYIDYGFCVCEKVYKRRRKADGSKYDDNLIGWKKLPIRAQSTIRGWEFSPDGRELVGVEQSLFNLVNMGVLTPMTAYGGAYVVLPRQKVLLFSSDARNGNPEGESPLKSAWLPWQYKKMVQEQEALGLSRELGGVPMVSLPARYMSPDASPEEAAIYTYYQNLVRNIHSNQQSGLVIPSDTDPETKSPLFKFDLLQSQGGKSYNTNDIIARYDSQILISLYADLLQMGNNAIGSFALAGAKTNIIGMAIEYRLKEIQDVLNFDLIPQTFRLNEWDDTDYPKFEYTDLDDTDMDKFAAAIQRLASTDSIEKDREFYNKTREYVGLTPFPETDPVHKEYLNSDGATSRSGDSFNTPSGGLDGTATSNRGKDNSVSNVSNSV